MSYFVFNGYIGIGDFLFVKILNRLKFKKCFSCYVLRIIRSFFFDVNWDISVFKIN